MTRFLANCEIEAHLSLAKGIGSLRYAHPKGDYTIYLRDQSAAPGRAEPLMSAMIAFDAPALQEARDIGADYLRDFLDYLTIVTNGTFKFRQIHQVFNWEVANGMREAMYFKAFPFHDVPIPSLNEELLATVSIMQARNVDARLRRCLKWFRSGVIESDLDDQFIYFWLVTEILAQVIKDTEPVPDVCPTCKTPLTCTTCNLVPVHRPFASQAIRQLFAKYVKGDWEKICETCMEFRNRLTHGDERSDIENALHVDFASLVDQLGRLAWTAIANQFIPDMAGKQVAFLHVNRYVHIQMSANAHINVGWKPNYDDPKPEDIPEIRMELNIEDEGITAEDGPPQPAKG